MTHQNGTRLHWQQTMATRAWCIAGNCVKQSIYSQVRQGLWQCVADKIGEDAYPAIEVQEPHEMEPETLAAFALGNAEYIDLVTAKHTVVHKTWKNRINVNKECQRSCLHKDAIKQKLWIPNPPKSTRKSGSQKRNLVQVFRKLLSPCIT